MPGTRDEKVETPSAPWKQERRRRRGRLESWFMSIPSPPGPDRVLVEAERVDQIASRLRSANVEVPGLASGRQNDDVEIYSVIRVLGSRPFSLADFPLRLVKRERPDFLLTLGAVEIGIEHTEAISQNKAKEEYLRDAGEGPDVYFVRRESLTEPLKTSAAIKEEIAANRMTPGWYGDSVEREWVQAMTHFVVKKSRSTQRPGFARFEKTWLVVYDNWTAPALNLMKALPLLRAAIDSAAVWSVFDRVFVLEEDSLLEIDGISVTVYCVNHFCGIESTDEEDISSDAVMSSGTKL